MLRRLSLVAVPITVFSMFAARSYYKNINTKDNFYRFQLNTYQKIKLTSFKFDEERPIVVSLYDENDGGKNAALAIQYFKKQGLDVITVSPDEGLKHPIFKKKIHGFILPGGSDIDIQDKAHRIRKQFEGALIKRAQEDDIPLIGICRGMQAIGYHQGLSVTDLPSDEDQGCPHYDEPYGDYNGTVVVKSGSQLFNALQKEFGKSDRFEYGIVCLHHQHIEESIVGPPPSEVTGLGAEHVIEARESKTGPKGKYLMIGYQHHPEVLLSRIKQNKILVMQREQEKFEIEPGLDDLSGKIFATFNLFKKTFKPSYEQRAARVELGLFADQVKHKFLDVQGEEEREADRSHSCR